MSVHEPPGELPAEQRALLVALAAPKVRGKLPPRKWGKMESREEVAALLAAAGVSANAQEYELALRGYLRAFEVTRSTPLLLSVLQMHMKLGELDEAESFCKVLQEQAANLSSEQKTVLARKEREIMSSKHGSKASKPPTRRMSEWHAKLDQSQLEQLSK